jgi:ribonucleoside-diphosphate reductase alpha chain
MFIRMAKEGSTVAGLMDSMAISVSVALQYGVPLRDLVNKFAHVRFEPSGFTGNPEIPIAKSIVDYIFRWLGSRFLPKEEREALGILDRSGEGREDEPSATAGISAAGDAPAELPGGSTAVAATAPSSAPAAGSAGPAGTDAHAAGAPAPEDAIASPAATATSLRPAGPEQTAAETASESSGPSPLAGRSTPPASSNGHAGTGPNGASKSIGMQLGRSQKFAFQAQADAPSCADCGSIMVRNGSCYKCLNCGSTSGCS